MKEKNMGNTWIYLIYFLIGQFIISCGPLSRNSNLPPSGNDSSVSSISMKLPDKSKFNAKAQEKLDGFFLSISPKQTCPGAKEISVVGKWDQAELEQKIIRNCEYILILKLGKLAADNKNLEAVYFENSPLSVTGTGPKTQVTLTVNITEEGIAEGMGNPGDPVINPNLEGALCLIQNSDLTIKTSSSEKECVYYIESQENALRDYLEPGEFKKPTALNWNYLQRSARVIHFLVNQKRISARSNTNLMQFFKEYLKKNSGLAEGSTELAKNLENWRGVESIISQSPDERGTRRDVSAIVPFPQNYVNASQPENERALFDDPAERHAFESGTVLEGNYSETELFDILKRTANLYFIPANGAIVAVQDMVDGRSFFKLSEKEKEKYLPFRDTFFYLYRDGDTKKVVEVLANLRHSSGGGPYYNLSEFGIFKLFADIHISDSSGSRTAAGRGYKSWDFSGSQLSSVNRKSYNMHPGGYSSLSSAGCATVRNRNPESGKYSKDYYVYMNTIQSFAFHADKVIGDTYDITDPAIKKHIDMNALFLRKIIVH